MIKKLFFAVLFFSSGHVSAQEIVYMINDKIGVVIQIQGNVDITENILGITIQGQHGSTEITETIGGYTITGPAGVVTINSSINGTTIEKN